MLGIQQTVQTSAFDLGCLAIQVFLGLGWWWDLNVWFL